MVYLYICFLRVSEIGGPRLVHSLTCPWFRQTTGIGPSAWRRKSCFQLKSPEPPLIFQQVIIPHENIESCIDNKAALRSASQLSCLPSLFFGCEEGPQGKSHPFLSFLLLGWPAERPEVHQSGSGTPPHPADALRAREHLARKETGSGEMKGISRVNRKDFCRPARPLTKLWNNNCRAGMELSCQQPANFKVSHPQPPTHPQTRLLISLLLVLFHSHLFQSQSAPRCLLLVMSA